MAKYYQLNKHFIIVKPLAFLVPIGIAMVILLLLLPFTTILIMVKGHLQDIEPKFFAIYIIMLPLLLGCISFFTYGHRQVIFDATQHAIYQKTIFSKKELMQFNRVADIKWQTRFGLVYYIKSKDDRYGKGYRISPSFTNEADKAKQEYDSLVLMTIWNMLHTQPAGIMEDNGSSPLNAGLLNHYMPHPDGYLLKPTSITKFLLVMSIVGIIACYSWYQLLSKPILSNSDKEICLLLLIPVAACALTLSKRVVFDVARQNIKVYRLGILFGTYPLAEFAGFNIVRKTYNGLYNGTDVQLKFIKPGSKTTRELILANFNKTNPIEPFIAETEYVMKKLKQGL